MISKSKNGLYVSKCKIGASGVLLMALASCGSSEAPISDAASSFAESRADGAALANLLESYPNTDWAKVPVMGSARYFGSTMIAVDGGVLNGTEISGDAEIKVDFAGKTVTGTLDNFFGQNSAGKVEAFYGSIDLPTGQVGRVDPNDLFADYVGTLSGFDHDLEFDGEVGGRFIKTPIIGVELDDSAATILVDGAAVAGSVQIVAEN